MVLLHKRLLELLLKASGVEWEKSAFGHFGSI
jgi:hypothetical protein